MSEPRDERVAASNAEKPVPVESLLDEDDFAVIAEENLGSHRKSKGSPVSDAASVDLRQIAEAARDACLAVERDGGRRFDLLKRMDDAMERLQDELPAERVLALLDAAEARPLVQPREGSPAARDERIIVVEYDGTFPLVWLWPGERVGSAGDGTGACIIYAPDGGERRVNIGDLIEVAAEADDPDV